MVGLGFESRQSVSLATNLCYFIFISFGSRMTFEKEQTSTLYKWGHWRNLFAQYYRALKYKGGWTLGHLASSSVLAPLVQDIAVHVIKECMGSLPILHLAPGGGEPLWASGLEWVLKLGLRRKICLLLVFFAGSSLLALTAWLQYVLSPSFCLPAAHHCSLETSGIQGTSAV